MWITLAAMTASASMILVDQTAVPLATPHAVEDLGAQMDEGQWIMTANILPLAAFLVLGGKLGDLFGLRKVFLIGSLIFGVATALAGFAQDMPWMIAARVAQGTGAALMMPTGIAIVSSVFPDSRRGTALGILAGGSAFFAALGPVLGGLLTSIDWRLVFLINVPLAAAAALMTLSATPRLAPGSERPKIDWAGVVTFAIAIAGFTFGLSQGPAGGWDEPRTIVPLAASLVFFVIFAIVELRVANPMIEFRLFRHLNFLAANISQFLAGMVELGLGFLIPFYLLLVVGTSPAEAGIALLPGTVPIILAGPLAGRAFDRFGGRMPLVIGYLVLAASGVALAMGVGAESAVALIPGLALQGIGLGVVLTTNDPTGLTAVPDDKQGEAAGIINTTEQMGGAIGIAVLLAIELSYYFEKVQSKVSDAGHTITPEIEERFRTFILHAEEVGLKNAAANETHDSVFNFGLQVTIESHVEAFRLVFIISAAIALVGAVLMFLLVRKSDRVVEGPVFARRSRWVYSTASVSPGITKRPDPVEHHDD